MKRKLLCVSLVLMMCLMAAIPAYADLPTPPDEVKGGLQISWDLYQLSGSQYKAFARVFNGGNEPVYLDFTLYDSNNNQITYAMAYSYDTIIKISRTVNLTPGTYTMEINVAGNTVSRCIISTYNI